VLVLMFVGAVHGASST